MIPQSFIQELLNRVDIVELINERVPLKKTGKNYQACCPFHREKTPSFSVSPSKQFYKCFGCGAYGNAIGFVMTLEGITYPEAIRRLAERQGMVVPEDPGTRQREKRARTLTDFMGQAADFYREALATNPRCRQYLAERGISPETAERFALGYSPDGWQNLQTLFHESYNGPELDEKEGCGLVIVNEQGRRYDRFRGRLMFPIRNPRGQVIGFGARTLNGNEHPKYLNSPETPIYHKGQEIYGLHEAADAIRNSGRAIVCEGYMDVIQLSQAGFAETVAALGTSITGDHVRKLLKMVSRVYFSFDGDSAGQHALRRALEAALPVIGDSHELRFVVLPPQHDPDSLIKDEGREAFEEQLKRSMTLSQYFVHSLSQERNLATAEGRSAFLNEAKPLVVGMRNAPILRRQILAELAMHARMTPDALEQLFGLVTVQAPAKPVSSGWIRRPGEKRDRRVIEPRVGVSDVRERILINLLSHPQLCEQFSSQIEERFVGEMDPIARRITQVWRTQNLDGESVTEPHVLLELLRESPDYRYYANLTAREMQLMTPPETAARELEAYFVDCELEDINEELTQMSSAAEPDLVRMQRLYAQRMELAKRVQALRATQLQ